MLHRHVAAVSRLSLLLVATGLIAMSAGCFDAGDLNDEGAPLGGDAGAGNDSSTCADDLELCAGECADLETDLDHCGACNTSCEADAPNMVAACESGACEMRCEEGWFDLDNDEENGCEYECAPTNDGVEICDGRDNDCDGEVDNEAEDAGTWYADEDGDGFGDPGELREACEQPDGYVENDRDCDDEDEEVHPGAEEVCGDGVDNDCDGEVDDPTAVDATEWFVDCDGDGFALDEDESVVSCEKPDDAPDICGSSDAGWTNEAPEGQGSIDCHDGEPDAFPGQDEWFDEPMSGDGLQTDEWDYDCDGDREERRSGQASDCIYVLDDCVGGGWTDYKPSCGVEAPYKNCFAGVDGDYCMSLHQPRTQTCR